jgi:hypothetical protein
MIVERMLKAAGVAVLLVAAIACQAQPRKRPLDIGPTQGVLPEARKVLEGRWTLESFIVHEAGKPPITAVGSGVLNFDDFGNLRMEIRADEATADLLRAAGIEMRDGIISSEGRTVIDMQNHTLTYFMEGQRSSLKTGGGPLALNRPRHWELTGDVLTLTTRDDTGEPVSVSRWKKNP